MGRRHLVAIGLLATIACKDGVSAGPGTNEKATGAGVSASGVVYGFTAAPDSQRVALAGATVTLVRVGDLPPPLPPGPQLPPGSDTLTSGHVGGVLDSVIPPPPEHPPLPPAACDAGVTVAEVRTGSDGGWSATGLESGIYNVRVDGPAESQWRSIEYCGWVVQQEENDITFYLPFGPGPDPAP